MMKRILILHLTAACMWAPAFADTAYVSDKVYVDIRTDAHYESPVAHRLLAGTKLEVLGQSGDFTRVQDAQGRVGWIENRELTRDLPASLRQAQVERELATMRTELVKTQRDLEQAQKVLAEDTADENAIAAAQSALKRDLAGTRKKLAETRTTLARAQAAVAKSQQELNRAKAALAEETARNKELASQLVAKTGPQGPSTRMESPPPMPAPLVPAASVAIAPATAEPVVVGSGDGPLPPLAPETPTAWQRILDRLAALDFLWLGISFAMLIVGLALGAIWWRERHRRKLGGMYLRI